MAGLNDKAGADGLSLPPWADIQCCPHPISRSISRMSCAVRCGNRAATRGQQSGGTDRSRSSSRSFSVGSIATALSLAARLLPRVRSVAPRAGDGPGAKGWRWPHDPQRSGLAARSAVAAVTMLQYGPRLQAGILTGRRSTPVPPHPEVTA